MQWAGAVNGTVVAAGTPTYYPDWQATIGVAADGAGLQVQDLTAVFEDQNSAKSTDSFKITVTNHSFSL